jgi:uncharacterized protein (TIGR04141 family)
MANPTVKKLQQVNIHLLKASVTDFKKALAKGKTPSTLKARPTVLPGGVLYHDTPPAKAAGWRGFLAPAFSNQLPSFNSQHSSAVLFFKAGNGRNQRSFAVTFGYGRALLEESALESDFGLRTALNLCDTSTLRAVDYRTIEERTRIGRIQLSDAGSVDAFRMNLDTDLLRGLEAESNDKKVCEKIGARWSNLIVAARIEVSDLGSLARSLLKCYKKKSLPTEYAWIENVRRVSDPSLLESLERDLEDRINNDDFAGIRLAMPDVGGSTTGIEARLFGAKLDAEAFTSDFADYLAKRKRQVKWTAQSAKNSQKVFLIDAKNGAEMESISLFRSIVAEVKLKNELYLLVDGEWFCLNQDFVAEVNKVLKRIPVLKHQYPKWIDGEAEGIWNKRACNSCKDAALLDKANISHGGGHSKIEVADILTSGLVLGHVKRRDKSSSGLSHLFAQAVVSSRLLHQDEAFRQKVAKVVPSSHKTTAAKLKRSFDPPNWTIAYVILGADEKAPADSLPFFSKVNLKGAVEQLKLMNYKVGLIGI